MAHANAPLTELGRLRLARYRVEEGATLRQTAERFQVSTTTMIRWCRRYEAVLAQGRHPVTRDMAEPVQSPAPVPDPHTRAPGAAGQADVTP